MIKRAIKEYLQRSNVQQLRLKAMLFDMDGVLYDSMRNHTRSWYDTISALGIPCTREEFYLFEGRTGSSTIDELFMRTWQRGATEEEREEIYAEKSRRFNCLPRPQVMPFARALLDKVIATGITPILVTGSGQQSLFEKLMCDFPGVFDSERMVTAFDVKLGKPHPEPYLMGLERAGVAPHQAMVVENAPLGVESASRAGIFTIAVNTGPLDNAVLYQSGANYLLPSMKSLYTEFETIYQATQP